MGATRSRGQSELTRQSNREMLGLMYGLGLCLISLAPVRVCAEPTLAEEAAFQAAVARVAAAVVRIEPLALTAVAGSGVAEAAPGSGPSTGTIVAPDLVLTTAFAIPADVDACIVVLPDGGRRAARVRARDRSRSLVLLAVDGLPDAPPLDAVPRAALRPGQWAIAVGRGWSAAAPNVALGIVSATNRAWGRGVQTDAAVSPVNYGGPLVDIAGRVIGILAALPAEPAGMTEGTELYDAGIGFAVPLEDVLAVLPRLAHGESLDAGILGVTYRSRDQINGEPFVASVRQGSPAARAGLMPGDGITTIDGRDIARIADARHAIGPKNAGDTISIAVERTNAEGTADRIETTATLVGAMPPWRRAIIGVVASAETSDAERGPVRIAWVLPGSPAEKARIVAGDVIESITRKRDATATLIEGRASAAGVLAGAEPGERVTLSIRRDDAIRTIEVGSIAMPSDVPGTMPAEGPPAPGPVGDPLAGPGDAVEVVTLAGADVADPAIAVIPKGTRPVGVLVWAGSPHGKVAAAEDSPWKAAAARHDVAVVLVGSADPTTWSRSDIAAVTRALEALHGRRPIDPARVGVAGTGAGAAFAWMVAERLGRATGGVALVGATLPQRAELSPAEPGMGWWVLLGPGDDDAAREGVERDRQRLDKAGYPAGVIPENDSDTPPADLLCRWVSVLGLL